MTAWVVDLLGLKTQGVLLDPATALPAVAFMTIWSNLGFNFIIVLAGIQAIPQDFYDSSRIDGANGWKTFRYITLPLLTPTLMFLVIITTINAFQAFTQFNVLIANEGPNSSTNVMVFSLFNAFFINNRYGFASAIAVVLFVVLLGVEPIAVQVDREESALPMSVQTYASTTQPTVIRHSTDGLREEGGPLYTTERRSIGTALPTYLFVVAVFARPHAGAESCTRFQQPGLGCLPRAFPAGTFAGPVDPQLVRCVYSGHGWATDNVGPGRICSCQPEVQGQEPVLLPVPGHANDTVEATLIPNYLTIVGSELER